MTDYLRALFVQLLELRFSCIFIFRCYIVNKGCKSCSTFCKTEYIDVFASENKNENEQFIVIL